MGSPQEEVQDRGRCPVKLGTTSPSNIIFEGGYEQDTSWSTGKFFCEVCKEERTKGWVVNTHPNRFHKYPRGSYSLQKFEFDPCRHARYILSFDPGWSDGDSWMKEIGIEEVPEDFR